MIQKRSDRFEAVQALSRRHFLKTATATSAVMSFGGVAPQVFCHAAETAREQQRVLVVVEMAGSWLSTLDDCSFERRHLYFMSYLPLSLIYSAATLNNSMLLLRQFG